MTKTGPGEARSGLSSGGGGNRTRVRASIHQRFYVRSPPIEVSSRWPVDGPLLDESSRVSPAVGRRGCGLARICDTYRAASGGLPDRQGGNPKVTQPEPSWSWQLKNSRVFYQEPEDLGTLRQLHDTRRSWSPPLDVPKANRPRASGQP